MTPSTSLGTSSSTASFRKVTFDAKRQKVEVIEQAEEVEKCFLRVTGMTCGSCVSHIERNLMKQEGKLLI